MPRLKAEDAKMLDEFAAAKRMRDFATSDKLRDELRRKGIRADDLKGGPALPPRQDAVNRPFIVQTSGPSTFDDWRCSVCSFLNFPHRKWCKICDEEYDPGCMHTDEYERGLQEIEVRGRNGFGEILWEMPELKKSKKKKRRGSSSSSRDRRRARSNTPSDEINPYDAYGRRLSEREITRRKIRLEKEKKERKAAAEAKGKGWNLDRRSRSRSRGKRRRRSRSRSGSGPQWAKGPRWNVQPTHKGNRLRSLSPAEAGPHRAAQQPPPAPPRFTRMALQPGLHEYMGHKKNV